MADVAARGWARRPARGVRRWRRPARAGRRGGRRWSGSCSRAGRCRRRCRSSRAAATPSWPRWASAGSTTAWSSVVAGSSTPVHGGDRRAGARPARAAVGQHARGAGDCGRPRATPATPAPSPAGGTARAPRATGRAAPGGVARGHGGAVLVAGDVGAPSRRRASSGCARTRPRRTCARRCSRRTRSRCAANVEDLERALGRPAAEVVVTGGAAADGRAARPARAGARARRAARRGRRRSRGGRAPGRPRGRRALPPAGPARARRAGRRRRATGSRRTSAGSRRFRRCACWGTDPLVIPFGPVPLTPTSFLDRARAVSGSRTALVDGEVRRTYAELGDRCERLAGALAGLGVAPGDRVSVLSPNTGLALEAHFGVPWAGAVLNALNTRLAAGELGLDRRPRRLEGAARRHRPGRARSRRSPSRPTATSASWCPVGPTTSSRRCWPPPSRCACRSRTSTRCCR